MKMKYFSMFSGIGGFEYGIQCAFDKQSAKVEQDRQRGNGVTNQVEHNVLSASRSAPLCVGYSEIDKYAVQIYEKHFGKNTNKQQESEREGVLSNRHSTDTSSEQGWNKQKEHINYGNCKNINWSSVEEFDLLVGGFPCQAFSIAGKRGGFDDTRGTLFFEIARCLREKQPRLFLLENVKGLLSHDKGQTFFTIITTLDELGYDLQWQVLNSKNFGVPQNRERVFIVGHLRGTSRPKVFPITASNGVACKEGQVANTLTSNYYKGAAASRPMIKVKGTLEGGGWEKRHEQIRRVHDPEGLSPTIPTGTGGGVMTKVAIPTLTPDRLEKRQNGRRFKENGDPAFTLTAQDKHGVFDGCKIRRLTPRECERLQGFPDDWTRFGISKKHQKSGKRFGTDKDGYIHYEISDTQRYKCLGNAVTTNVITAIMEKLLTNQDITRRGE